MAHKAIFYQHSTIFFLFFFFFYWLYLIPMFYTNSSDTNLHKNLLMSSLLEKGSEHPEILLASNSTFSFRGIFRVSTTILLLLLEYQDENLLSHSYVLHDRSVTAHMHQISYTRHFSPMSFPEKEKKREREKERERERARWNSQTIAREFHFIKSVQTRIPGPSTISTVSLDRKNSPLSAREGERKRERERRNPKLTLTFSHVRIPVKVFNRVGHVSLVQCHGEECSLISLFY